MMKLFHILKLDRCRSWTKFCRAVNESVVWVLRV